MNHFIMGNIIQQQRSRWIAIVLNTRGNDPDRQQTARFCIIIRWIQKFINFRQALINIPTVNHSLTGRSADAAWNSFFLFSNSSCFSPISNQNLDYFSQSTQLHFQWQAYQHQIRNSPNRSQMYLPNSALRYPIADSHRMGLKQQKIKT